MLNTFQLNGHQLDRHEVLHSQEKGQPELDQSDDLTLRKHHGLGGYSRRTVRLDDDCDPEDLRFLETSFPELNDFLFLGRGGFGAVFSANQSHMNRRVAVKLLHAELALDKCVVERFQQEARAQAGVVHPNIVTVFDAGIRSGRPYIVMEYVPNGTLRSRISSRPFNTREALSMLQQLCDALECSHGERLIHRDIKPENILIDHQGNLKLSDFGLARIVSEMHETDKSTDYYYAGGIMNYMAPELISRPWAADARTDLYAVIVVFYEAMMGEIPRGSYEAPSSKSRMVRRLRKQVDAIVFRGLQSNPNRRFQTAIELRKHVDAIVNDPRLTKRVSMKWSLTNEEHRKYWLAAAMAVMLLQMAFTGFYYVRNLRRLDRQNAFTSQAFAVAQQREDELVAVKSELKKIKSQQEQRMSLVDPNEFNAIVKLSDDSAWLNHDFGTKELSADERLAIDRILSEMRQEYLHIELANTTQDVRPDETIVSTIRMKHEYLDELEERLWNRIDSSVSVAAQKLLRDTLPLFVDCTSLVTEMPGKTDSKRLAFGKLITTDPSVSLDGINKPNLQIKRLFPSKLRYPQLFGWNPEDTPIRISIKRKGMWFAWHIEQSVRENMTANGSRQQTSEKFRIVDNGESPVIPAGLRRFWWDPSTGIDTPVRPVKSDSKVEIVSLRSINSANLPEASTRAKKSLSD